MFGKRKKIIKDLTSDLLGVNNKLTEVIDKVNELSEEASKTKENYSYSKTRQLEKRFDALQVSDLKRKQSQRIKELDLKLNEQKSERLIKINKHLIGSEVNVVSFHYYGGERRHQGKLEYLAVGVDNCMSAFFKDVTIHGVALVHEIID